MAPNERERPEEVFDEVEVKKLPSFSDLQIQVKQIVRSSSWFTRYGVDWCYIIGAIASVPIALQLLKLGGVVNWIIATLVLGSAHSILGNKAAHIAAHGGLAESRRVNELMCAFATEFVTSISYFMGDMIHIQGHHPHTNIIGLGDSSTWKVPYLPRMPYLFMMPFLLPVVGPLIMIQQLIEGRYWFQLLRYLPVLIGGLAFHVYLLHTVAGFSITGALQYMWLYRAVFSLSYIHVNIFQHIGLPMYSEKSRPSRIYQMSTGVLNLSRNPVLDHVFGHSLINCHVEHHLFPKLSDNMCLKIKPVVESYLRKHGLTYNTDSYMSRLAHFWNRYDELMVQIPPITHFIAI